MLVRWVCKWLRSKTSLATDFSLVLDVKWRSEKVSSSSRRVPSQPQPFLQRGQHQDSRISADSLGCCSCILHGTFSTIATLWTVLCSVHTIHATEINSDLSVYSINITKCTKTFLCLKTKTNLPFSTTLNNIHNCALISRMKLYSFLYPALFYKTFQHHFGLLLATISNLG